VSEFLLWIFYALLILAASLAVMNQWRLWKKPYLFKGDTGAPGMTGPMGLPGVCHCEDCSAPPDNPKLRGSDRAWDEHRQTKEDVYGLPPVD
jgi:hypothetical protein